MLPESLQIQTIDYCNRTCDWCPNSYMEKSSKAIMSPDTFTKILVDLEAAGYKGAVHLYLMGEPLCDPNIIGRIGEARERLPNNIIFISTNGDLLDGPDHVQALFDAGLTWMSISDYDMRGDFAYTARFPDVVVTSINQLEPTYYNRAGYVDVHCSHPVEMCEWVFKKAYINYKGDMILCCSDYEYKTVFGNIHESTFTELFASTRYRQYRRAHIQGKGATVPLCSKCNRICHNA